MQFTEGMVTLLAITTGVFLSGMASVARAEPPRAIGASVSVPSNRATDSRRDRADLLASDGQGKQPAVRRSTEYKGTPTSATGTAGVVCEIDGASNCHMPDVSWILTSDLATPWRAADDFVPLGTEITEVCWWGVYVDPYTSTDCSPGPGDDFTITFYEDAAGLPGNVLSSQSVTVSKALGDDYTGWIDYEYTAVLPTPVSVTPGTCYWVEIANNTTGPPADCTWMWDEGSAGNDYAMSDGGETYGPEDFLFDLDLAFCVDTTIQATDCGDVLGTCCQCPADCSQVAVDDCYATGGNWQLGGTCTPNPCLVPDNDDCAASSAISDGITPFDTRCATTDGPATTCGGDDDLEEDIWFEYTATSSGLLTVSLCDNTLYDAFIAIYGDGTPDCPCPSDDSNELACNDDGCDGEAFRSSSAELAVRAGDCYTIRVGGHPYPSPYIRSAGPGEISITFASYVYVDADATGPTHDGSTWCRAYQTLQDALSTVTPPATIHVANGTYRPDQGGGHTPLDRTATFQLANGVTVKGGYAGCGAPDPDERNIELHETILSGDLISDDDPNPTSNCCAANGGLGCVDASCEAAVCAEDPTCCSTEWGEVCGLLASILCCDVCGNRCDNSYHVVTGTGGDASTVLDGVTITAGHAGLPGAERGGGLYNNPGSPTVRYCTFDGNVAHRGGGMCNLNGSDPTVFGCTFTGNLGDYGGGMRNVTNSNPTVTDCTFSGNRSPRGGGMHNWGNANPTLINCTFIGNSTAGGSGGGLWNMESSPTLTNCVFTGNFSDRNGGGILNWFDSSPTLTNCIFSGNSAGGNGGGALNSDNSHPTMVNCTFSGNSAAGDGGGMDNYNNSSPTLANCILWRNVDDADGDSGGPFTDESAQIHTTSGTPVVTYSCIQDDDPDDMAVYPGTGNIDDDPSFIDPKGGDNIAGTEDDRLQLRVGSPVIDAGNNTVVPPDTQDLDGDLDIGEPIPIDLGGDPRFVDDPGTADTGSGTPPIVDMGAYEYQPVIFVDASATGAQDGTTWSNAYTKLQDALSDAAGSLRDIWVASGTYTPDAKSCTVAGDCDGPGGGTCPSGQCVWNSPREQTFQLLNGVGIYGGFAGTETARVDRDIAANITVLSGDLTENDITVACLSDSPDCDSYGGQCIDGFCVIKQNNSENSYTVVTGNGTDRTARLDGFRITGGNADGTSPPFENDSGGGMYNWSGNPTVANCTFTGNSADNGGGGMHNTADSSPSVTNCTFSGNMAGWAGGGMCNGTSSPTLTGCTFSNNVAGSEGGGLINNDQSNPIVTDCIFSGNVAEFGGGIRNEYDSNPTLTNCTFSGNSAVWGGGVRNTDSNPMLTNCTFSGNSAGNSGGGLGNYNSDPTLINCTFTDNSADGNGGGIYNRVVSNPTLANCILWDNVDDADGNGGGPFTDESAQIHTDSGTPIVTYSCIQDNNPYDVTVYPGMGNIDDDPLLVDADGPDNIVGTGDDNLRLSSGSPCIDAGDTTDVPADMADLDGDGNTTERTPFDLDGYPRVLNDPSTVDTGVPGSAVVDMGTHEFVVDCNRNGLPDDCDLDCAASGGACNLPGCGLSVDVNPANGEPDECVQFIGGCVSDNDWSCYDNWNIPGDVYPNNSEVSTYSVTLDGITDDVFLDLTVEIDTLGLLNGAKVSITQTDGGDLSVVAPGGIYNKGYIVVANDRQITLASGSPTARSGRQADDTTGAFTIGAGGVYEADGVDPSHDGCIGDLMCASLSAGSITILPGDCDIPAPGGRMTLREAMSVGVAGDIVLQGSLTPTCPGCRRDNGEALTLRGITPPPKLWTGGKSDVAVGAAAARAATAAQTPGVGNFVMTGAVDTTNDSTVGMSLAGDFDNRSTYPSLFNWANGKLILNGIDAQTFEVAGLDLGPTSEGYDTDQDTLFDTDHHTNYAIGDITIEDAPGSPLQITFVNSFANTAGAGPCDEALYVGTLTLQDGSTVTLDDCRVYCRNLVDNGANIESTGCGELVELCTGDAPGAPTGEAGYEKVRYISMVPGNPAQQTALRVTLTNLPAPFSGFNGTKCWVGEPQQVSENAGKVNHQEGWPDFWSANLQGTPHCMDWSAAGVLHVTDDDIIPGAFYDVQAIGCDCDFDNEADYSTSLTINTSRWGDLVRNCTTCPCGAPDGTVGVPTDVTAALDKFKNLRPPSIPCDAVIKSRADVEPNFPDWLVNISDVTFVLDAFRGCTFSNAPPFPFCFVWSGPGGCP